MEYFKIGQEKKYRNILRPLLPSMSQIWGEEKPLLVQGKAEQEDKDICFLPFYQASISRGQISSLCIWACGDQKI